MKTLTRRSLIAPATIAALALALTGCAGGGRPSADELTNGLKQITGSSNGDITDSQYHCIAEKLVASDVSDDTLRNLKEGKDVSAKKSDNEKLQSVISDNTEECLVNTK